MLSRTFIAIFLPILSVSLILLWWCELDAEYCNVFIRVYKPKLVNNIQNIKLSDEKFKDSIFQELLFTHCKRRHQLGNTPEY